MSARKLSVGPLEPVTFQARQTRLDLPAHMVAIHKNGIEFRSPVPFSSWTEMTVSLSSSREGHLHCSGVVVNCSGNKHSGYRISMLFTSLTKQARAQLHALARSDLGAG